MLYTFAMLFMLPFIPSSLLLSSHSSEKLSKACRESSALITLNFSFFMMPDNPDELKGMKNQLAWNAVAYTFRPLPWGCPLALQECENGVPPLFNNADCSGRFWKLKAFVPCVHIWCVSWNSRLAGASLLSERMPAVTGQWFCNENSAAVLDSKSSCFHKIFHPWILTSDNFASFR